MIAPDPPRARGHPWRVGEGEEEPSEGGGERAVEGEEGVGGAPCEEAPGSPGREPTGGEGRRQCRVEPEAGEGDGVARDAHEGAEDMVLEKRPVGRHTVEDPPVGRTVLPETGGGLGDGAVDENRLLVLEGVGESHGSVNPFEPVIGEGEGAEERRSGGEGVDGRADVVMEAREGELAGAGTSADLVGALDDEDRGAGGGEGHRRRKPVGARSDHDGVVDHGGQYGHRLRLHSDTLGSCPTFPSASRPAGSADTSLGRRGTGRGRPSSS